MLSWRNIEDGKQVRYARYIIGVMLFLFATSHPTHAQEGAAATTGRWLPREVHRFTNLTAEQRAAAIATLEKIERLVKQVPELANPNGFEIVPHFDGGPRQQGPDGTELPGTISEYGLGLMTYRPTKALAGEGSFCISVVLNGRQEGRLRDEHGREIYIEDARGTPSTDPHISDSRVPLKALQVYGGLWNVPGERSGATVLFVTAGEVPWKLVSRETFYRAHLLDVEGADGEKLAAFREGVKKTPYQEWLAGAARRKAELDAAMAQLKGVVPDSEIVKMRRMQEATEREVGNDLKKDEATQREQNSDAYTRSFAVRDSLLAELTRMTPEERRMPAYINNALASGPRATGRTITADSAPPAWRVLTPDFDFYRVRRSPVEVRSIHVILSMSLTCAAPNVQHMVWQVYHKLDWAALNAMLETPR